MLEDSAPLIMILVMIMVITIVATLTMIAMTSWNVEEHPRTHYSQPSATHHRSQTFFSISVYKKTNPGKNIHTNIYGQQVMLPVEMVEMDIGYLWNLFLCILKAALEGQVLSQKSHGRDIPSKWLASM